MRSTATCVVFFLPLCAALSVQDTAPAKGIPTVPKVQDADADGFPVLPEAASLLKEASKEVQGLNRQASMLREEILKDEETIKVRMQRQKATWEQLLKKQEQENRKIQADNTGHAKEMMKLRDGARQMQAKIKKVEQANQKQRAELKVLQKQLVQAQEATEDALAGTQASTENKEELTEKPLSFLEVKPAPPSSQVNGADISAEEDDYGSDDTEMEKNTAGAHAAGAANLLAHGPPMANDDLSSQAKATAPAAVNSTPTAATPKASAKAAAEVVEAAHVPAKSTSKSTPKATFKAAAKVVGATPVFAKSTPKATPKATAKVAAKVTHVSQTTPPHHAQTNEESPVASHSPASNDQPQLSADRTQDVPEEAQSHEVADDVESAEQSGQASKYLVPDADAQTQVLREGASLADSTVAFVSVGLKKIQQQMQQSESQLKLSFQKAYKAGKVRHDALIKQSKALLKSMHSMQLQEQKLEATLSKVRTANKILKQKSESIGALLGRAAAPIGNANNAA